MNGFLDAVNICKRFGGVQALENVSVSFLPGEVHALMGENGAGKSTLGRILAGALVADKGTIHVDGRPSVISNPVDAQRLGIGIIFQELDLFPQLTVAENLVIRNLNFTERMWVNKSQLEKFCRPYLDQVGLAVRSDQRAGDLSIGKLQLVAIARALSMNARLIVMDESTSSLTDDAVENLFQIIRRLRDDEVTVVFVSHKLDEVFRICDRVTVLRDGRFVATHAITNVTPQSLIQLMVGRDLANGADPPAQPRSTTLLDVDRLTTRKLRDISFQLHSGEVLGIAGLVGAGRSALGAALFGLDRPLSGKMLLRGARFAPRHPREAMVQGVGLVPEDRKTQGLMMQMSLLDNASFAVLQRFSRWGWLRTSALREQIARIRQDVDMRATTLDAPVGTLSGGNQQKVLLGRWLLADPDVIFLDDPTRGVDVGAKEEIYGIIRQLAENGKGILFVSSELPELLRCSHRIMVLQEGRCRGILDAATALPTRILELAAHAQS